MEPAAAYPPRAARPPRLFAALLMLVGLPLLAGGVWLAALGGSLYYVVAGVALASSAILLWRGRAAGAWIYALLLAGTVAWALWEVGLDYWQLLPRIGLFAVLGLWLATPWARRGLA